MAKSRIKTEEFEKNVMEDIPVVEVDNETTTDNETTKTYSLKELKEYSSTYIISLLDSIKIAKLALKHNVTFDEEYKKIKELQIQNELALSQAIEYVEYVD